MAATLLLSTIISHGSKALGQATLTSASSRVHVSEGAAPQRVSPRLADYDIFVNLDVEKKTTRGHQTIFFTNTSARPLRELYFHLYLNAFENEKTLFMRDGKSRSGTPLSSPGHIEVKSLKITEWESPDLWPRASTHSPNDPADKTDISLPLPGEILPGESVTLELEFEARLPQAVERTGYEGDFFLLSQWFPKLAKLEPDGTWVHFPFHSQAEFYADFSNYRVVIDVPSGYEVGATGQPRLVSSDIDGRTRYEVVVKDVIDFAWTAWDKFQREEHTIFGVNVELFGARHTGLLRKRIADALRMGLPYLQRRFGKYPYDHLTVVLPPATANSLGGMEYPQFITTTGRAFAPYLGIRHAELVTFHELTHQWFQSIVATDEYNAPVLDEGFTAYVEWQFMEESQLGLLVWPGLRISRHATGRYAYMRWRMRSKRLSPLSTRAPDFRSFGDLSISIYARTPLCLFTLRASYGAEAFDRAFSRYVTQNRFRHPKVEDFLKVIEEDLGVEPANQARLMFFGDANLDLILDQVKTVTKADGGLVSSIEVGHVGRLHLPYSISVTHEDGSKTRILGRAEDSKKIYQIHHTSPILVVHVDPEHDNALDPDYFNNRAHFETAVPDLSGSATLERRLHADHSKTTALLWSWFSWLLQLGAG